MASFRFEYGKAWHAATLKILIVERDYRSACLFAHLLVCLFFVCLFGCCLSCTNNELPFLYIITTHIFLFLPAKFLPKNIIKLYHVQYKYTKQYVHLHLPNVQISETLKTCRTRILRPSPRAPQAVLGFVSTTGCLLQEFIDFKKGNFNCFLAAMF